jgi:putative nucleotidyltransferase with HDIG domain
MGIGEITFGFFVISLALVMSQLYLYFRSKRNVDFLYASLFFLCGTIFLFGQFQLIHNFSAQSVIFWDKFQNIGTFGYLYTLPLFSATVLRKKISRDIKITLAVLTVIIFGLVLFTNLILTDQVTTYLTVTRAGRGILFVPLIMLLIFVTSYLYIQIIKTSRTKTIKPVEYVPNYTPLIVGISIALFCGVLDLIGILRGKPTITGATWPFVSVGIFIVSISFIWTFLSKFSTFFGALSESQSNHEKLIERYNKNFFEFVQLIAKTIDAKDHYTAGHSLRVRNYAIKIATTLNLSHADITILEQAALLHDIGKIATPDGILNKKAPLTKEERQYINMHPVVAREILSTVSDFEDILDIIYHHHERIDGKGYPKGLKRDQIPLLARIIAVADTYDAMLSERPYRSAKTKDEAIDELIRVKGSQLDQEIVDRFIEVVAA